ncbi:DUF167 domain-containing protein [Candidatus Woesearchaeota archaeon]|nr:DUF167 domain-containing protein [Candidatus Woesearchaeota archaeon]
MEIISYIKNNSLKIIVKPNSKKNDILNYDKNKQALKVSIKAPPENNKANIEIIKFFNKLTKKHTKIIKGLTSKEKLLKFS